MAIHVSFQVISPFIILIVLRRLLTLKMVSTNETTNDIVYGDENANNIISNGGSDVVYGGGGKDTYGPLISMKMVVRLNLICDWRIMKQGKRLEFGIFQLLALVNLELWIIVVLKVMVKPLL